MQSLRQRATTANYRRSNVSPALGLVLDPDQSKPKNGVDSSQVYFSSEATNHPDRPTSHQVRRPTNFYPSLKD